MLTQPAFMPSSFIIVENALVNHAVNDRHRFAVACRGDLTITAMDGVNYLFYIGAHLRTHGHVVATAFLTGAGTLSCRLNVCQLFMTPIMWPER